ncbi:MAG: hypothetical protein U0822_14310 [Anaerolineae bacterium]
MRQIDQCVSYSVRVQGPVDPELLDECAPVAIGRVEADAEQTTTLSGIVTDQAGLVGLIRRLHGLGLTLVAIERMDNPDPISTRRIK